MDDIYHPVSSLEVTSDYAGMRLDNCLISIMKGLPRSKIYSIIRRGEVRVNKSRSRPSLKLNEGDIVRIPPYKASTKEETFTPSKDKEMKIAMGTAVCILHTFNAWEHANKNMLNHTSDAREKLIIVFFNIFKRF